VGVQCEIDANGILHVLARDTNTGSEKVGAMKSAVDVDDTAVQRRVEESVVLAFEDLAARRWIEAKLKANELLTATRKGLADCREQLEAAYVEQVEVALNEVQAALTTEQAATGSGDLKRLQAACTALDEATKPLADLLMDRAMEAMLRKRGLVS
jgi:molecular chaperone DnaK